MNAHDLINHIQHRIGKRVKFTYVNSAWPCAVQFLWGSNEFWVSGPNADNLNVLHVVSQNMSEQTLHSKYMQGVLRGGKRDESGTLGDEVKQG